MAAFLIKLNLKVRGEAEQAEIIANALAAIRVDRIPGFIGLGMESVEPVYDPEQTFPPEVKA